MQGRGCLHTMTSDHAFVWEAIHWLHIRCSQTSKFIRRTPSEKLPLGQGKEAGDLLRTLTYSMCSSSSRNASCCVCVNRETSSRFSFSYSQTTAPDSANTTSHLSSEAFINVRTLLSKCRSLFGFGITRSCVLHNARKHAAQDLRHMFKKEDINL
jgi:hypothetical protein